MDPLGGLGQSPWKAAGMESGCWQVARGALHWCAGRLARFEWRNSQEPQAQCRHMPQLATALWFFLCFSFPFPCPFSLSLSRSASLPLSWYATSLAPCPLPHISAVRVRGLPWPGVDSGREPGACDRCFRFLAAAAPKGATLYLDPPTTLYSGMKNVPLSGTH